MELSEKDGPYSTFKGSPISKGHFQFDLWKEFPTSKDKQEKPEEIEHSGRWDWPMLKRAVKKVGVRNSLCTAWMPTASTSQISGVSESFEPVTTNCYSRKTRAGEFILVNPYMTSDFIKHGLWNENMRQTLLQSRGSIQHLNIPQKLKDIYKSVWEIKQRVLIDHSIARGVYIDQSQSLNLYFEDGNPDLIAKSHFYGWSKGLKTGSYYIRTKPAVNSASFTQESKNENKDKDKDSKKEEDGEEEDEGQENCISCSA
jgi:ribonucleoside-diphosphate reductase alpha chain